MLHLDHACHCLHDLAAPSALCWRTAAWLSICIESKIYTVVLLQQQQQQHHCWRAPHLDFLSHLVPWPPHSMHQVDVAHHLWFCIGILVATAAVPVDCRATCTGCSVVNNACWCCVQRCPCMSIHTCLSAVSFVCMYSMYARWQASEQSCSIGKAPLASICAFV